MTDMRKTEINVNGARMSPLVWEKGWDAVKAWTPKRSKNCAFFLASIFTAEQPEPEQPGLHMLEFWRTYPKAKPRMMVRLRNVLSDQQMIEFLSNNRTPKIRPMKENPCQS
jgi:hypothetical protein